MRPSHASCPRCNQPVPPGSRYCSYCGVDTRSAQEQSETQAVGRGGHGGLPAQEELGALLQEATGDEFEIISELGRGGMATVFLAREKALGRLVAIKVMSPAMVYGEGMVERFKREARTAGRLSHPHIIPIHAVRETPDLLFFVMNYVEGRPLDSILRELHRLPVPMVQVILTHVGSALDHAHRNHVIHRDIKPANIMLDEEGYAVVTDFGIAKVDTQAGLTQAGAAVGTPSYMSPEQCAGQAIDSASDQYSLGVVAYEMLTGRPPFEGSMAEVMHAHFTGTPAPIESIRRDCPPALAHAVMRMLAKEPEQRFPTMDDVVREVGFGPMPKNDPILSQMIALGRSSEHRQPPVAGRTPVSRRAASAERPRVATPQPADRPGTPTPARGRPVVTRSRATEPLFPRWLLPVVLGILAAASGWLAVVVFGR